MKKPLLFYFLLVGFFANARFVQVTFDEGYFIQIVNTVPLSPSEGSSTSDSSINSILVNHNVYNCVQDYSSNTKMIIFFNYLGTNISAFVADLNNNENVSKVGLCYEQINDYFPTFADNLYIKLISNLNGTPINTNSNGNILTNNEQLNEIFETYNVHQMVQSFPNICCFNVYSIIFDGDITGLKNALDNLDSVIEYTELVGVIMLLSNDSFEKFNVQIYPNPFQNNFSIQTENTITNYSLFDLSGKILVNTSSKSEVDKVVSTLSSGQYLINLESENGQKITLKLIKE